MKNSVGLEKCTRNPKKINIWCLLLYTSILSYGVSANKFVYLFEKFENTKIKIYSELLKGIPSIEKKEEFDFFNVYYTIDLKSFDSKDHVYTYENKGFIGFEVLNNFLNANISEYINGKIECSFELVYFLKLTSDISYLPYNVNKNQFKCLFLGLKYLRAIDNKNIVKLLGCTFLKICSNQNTTDLKKEEVKYEGLVSFINLTELDFYLRKNLISGFINILMIKHIFYEDNLILLGNNNLNFDAILFNEHIPYKNLLINDYEVFCTLENFLSNNYYLNTFKFLLVEIGIKSLIINNCLNSETISKKFYFFSQMAHIFKSIIISNFQESSEIIIYELSKGNDINIEYFTLINSIIESNYLFSFLKKQSLKGLIFNNVIMNVYLSCFENYMNSNDTLEYIDFKNMEMGVSWWINFSAISNILCVILDFDSFYLANNFIKECSNIGLKLDLCYLELWFAGLKIPLEFCNFLSHCKSLKTLKFFNCFLDKKIEPNLYHVLESMKGLETLFLQNIHFSDKFYEFLFQKKGIKMLQLKNSCFPREILRFEILNFHKSITHLILINIKISEHILIEIFKLKDLKVLSLKFCGIISIKNSISRNFIYKNIQRLNLSGSDINIFESNHILTKLDNLESLHLSYFQFHSCCLTKLSPMCNMRLKTLSYKGNSLYVNDLNRIKHLATIEKLNFYKCKFIETSFYKLGSECRFFNSLKKLNLGCVVLGAEDFHYLRNFKKLKYLQISFHAIHLVEIKFNLISLAKSRFTAKLFFKEIDSEELSEYFKEEGVEEVCKWSI
ncbi:hypothetical protein CWI36_0588p0010 [Hamiltosporidium magnivora]|uniref:Leucine-rich repeat-containing protein n=1 Tax=Hamiltosporidium magnivora TaxID=148818 RepID=A0A4Q9LD27_9MICR|nr:hypothetical protein CWI36_0588p0010 [Hamiltosporidium magnivora]